MDDDVVLGHEGLVTGTDSDRGFHDDVDSPEDEAWRDETYRALAERMGWEVTDGRA